MTPISELYKSEVERYENTKFSKGGGLSFECSDFEGMYVELKENLRQSYLQICYNEIERLEGEMRETDERKIRLQFVDTLVGELNDNELAEQKNRNVGFNSALQSRITYWKEEMEKIKMK